MREGHVVGRVGKHTQSLLLLGNADYPYGYLRSCGAPSRATPCYDVQVPTFRVQCIYCKKEVADPVSQIGDSEAALLRAHLATCARSIDLSALAGLGDLLNHFHLTRLS
jgi:hypothetical protein